MAADTAAAPLEPVADPGAGPVAGAVAPDDVVLDPELAAAAAAAAEAGEPDPNAPVGPEEFTDDGEPALSDLFGMPRDEFMTAMEAVEDGVLPESMLDKMHIKVTRDGAEELMSLSDYRDGGLRQADYSRKLNTLRDEQGRFSRTQNDFAGMVEGWKAKPETMGDDLEMLGIDLEVVLEPIAAMYAAEAELTPRERELAKRARNAERRERMSILKRKAEQEVLDRGKRTNQHTALQEKVAGFRAPAFDYYKIVDGAVARDLFHSHLRNLWQRGDLTPRIAQDAAQATREDLIRMADDYNARKPAPATAAAPVAAPPGTPTAAVPPPARGAAPGGGGAARSIQQSGTVTDFRARMEAIRERGGR